MVKLKKIINNKYLPFVCCFLLMAVILNSMYTGWGDEIHFKLADGQSMFDYLKTQYLTTHAKIIADFLILVFLSLPQAAWATVTAALYALLAWSLFYLLLDSDEGHMATRTGWFIVILMFVYNFIDVTGAGWYATTINYVWPMACGVFALVPIKNACVGKKEKPFAYPLYIVAVIIGCAQEQIAAIIFCFYLVFSGYLIFNRKLKPIIIIQLALSLLSLAFLLSSPGNASRAQSEAEFWYPLFLTFNPLQKLYLGIITTVMDLIFSDNPLVFAFIILFPVFVFKSNARPLAKGISLLPLFLTCINNLFYDFLIKFYPMLQKIVPAMKEFTIATRNRYGVDDVSISAIMLGIAFLYITPIIVGTFFALDNHNRQTLKTASVDDPRSVFLQRATLAVLIVLAGFTSRFVIGFSPTMYASGPRTFVYLHFSLIAVLALLYKHDNIRINNITLFSFLSTASFLEVFRILYTGSLFN